MLFVTLDNLDSIFSLPPLVEGVELRLDLFKTLDLPKLEKTLELSPVPILFTLRKSSQGGHFSQSEEIREETIRKLLGLKPSFFDLEWDMDPEFIAEQIKNHPQVKIILSHHNFSNSPIDIEEIYKKMSSLGAYAYKIATAATSSNEVLSLLLLAKKYPLLSLIPMGEMGSFGRILALTLKNKIHYTYLSSKGPFAPGQISFEDLIQIYHYPKLNTHTKLYGLIGHPVTSSVGHIYHNAAFAKIGYNALYVKMCVTEEELEEFFFLAEQVGFQGLSITMPLKEKVVPFLQEIDSEASQIQAVNTLIFAKNGLYGTNTDGKGALDALERHTSMKGKTFILLGAGGASRSIAFEAKKRGAIVYIANRTIDRAKKLADNLGVEAISLQSIPIVYDVLLNTIPNIEFNPDILPSALVMDIVYVPQKTPFLEKALKAGCKVVYGEEMFTRQAEKQLDFWGIKKPLEKSKGL